MGNGNRPTPEFRREAVRLTLTSGQTRQEIAEDRGIWLSTLSRWLSRERDVWMLSGAGGRYPNVQCGLTVLEWMRPCSMRIWASRRL